MKEKMRRKKIIIGLSGVLLDLHAFLSLL